MRNSISTILALFLLTTSIVASAQEECSGAIACGKILAEKMRGDKNGVTRLSDWWNGWTNVQESEMWKVNQLRGNFVMYLYVSSSGNKDFLIAVKKSSIKAPVAVGRSLASSAECLKYGGETETKNLQGFPIKVRIFEAVSCE